MNLNEISWVSFLSTPVSFTDPLQPPDGPMPLRVEIEKIVDFFKNKRQKLRRSGIAIKRVFHEESPA